MSKTSFEVAVNALLVAPILLFANPVSGVAAGWPIQDLDETIAHFDTFGARQDTCFPKAGTTNYIVERVHLNFIVDPLKVSKSLQHPAGYGSGMRRDCGILIADGDSHVGTKPGSTLTVSLCAMAMISGSFRSSIPTGRSRFGRRNSSTMGHSWR
ncbi:hypothetical protein HFO77_29125 [Rhizobium leguminosarum]|uniref:hypothetical protein n=1 Tax=Rhizobium leguminosarum TaxID=384 RepID=UPI001C98BE97|nr:hypothetical protein [Rhizobium leguminosarum]MBY5918457.1 hypothetical protein [Rhizobium leguminosarum]